MKILVTGATGFIGNYVIEELLKQEFQIIATSRNIEKAKEKSWFKKVIYIEHDLNNVEDNLFHKFNEPDLLIHLAWNGLPNYKKLFHIEKELMNQYHFIKNLVVSGLTNVNITGTCFEYGMLDGQLNEELVVSPQNPYAIAKNSLRIFLEQLQLEYSFKFKWMRLFYMYGKGQNENAILSQLQNAINKHESIFNMSLGEQIRDYLSIEEVAKHIVKVSLHNNTNGIINISSNEPIKIIDLVKKYLLDTKQTISLNLGFYPYPDYEPFSFWGDNTKLKNI
jgi:dTDP-6-deoxy-L-talose 4-dehydrogenase (NAD+)